VSEQRHPIEVMLRASIDAVRAVTGETFTDLGEALGLSVALVGRRQRGVTPWSVAELGKLGEHWGIPPCALISSPSDALAELPSERIAELRTARGLPVFSSASVVHSAA